MELRQLNTFRAVADHESFTRAAQILHMAQSSVSAQIKSLEQELSVRLFDRIGRRVLITEAGKSLYEYARRMGEMTKEIKSEVSGQNTSQARGSLVIRVPETLASVYMPAIIEQYHALHPWVKLVFINCSDLQLREELNSGRIDLAFLMTDAVNFKEVNLKMLGTEHLILTAAPFHKMALKKNFGFKDLDGQTLLLPKTD